jgi:cellobiose phosphorylase
LVISDLLGIKPDYNNYIEINPLIPDDWDWFAIEKIKYQDKLISVIWDRTGKKFNVGKGLLLIVDNKIVDRRKKIEKIIYKFEHEK